MEQAGEHEPPCTLSAEKQRTRTMIGADRVPCQQRNKELEQKTGADMGTRAPLYFVSRATKISRKDWSRQGTLAPQYLAAPPGGLRMASPIRVPWRTAE